MALKLDPKPTDTLTEGTLRIEVPLGHTATGDASAHRRIRPRVVVCSRTLFTCPACGAQVKNNSTDRYTKAKDIGGD